MSAWIVDRLHIDVLVQALTLSETVVDRSPDNIGRELWLECLKSVAYRYPNDASGERPGYGHSDAEISAYTFTRPTVTLTPDQLLKQLDCYGYQSCEHAEWLYSAAFSWCETLSANLMRSGTTRGSADYQAAPWGDLDELVPT